ncbi:hypothetical protein EV356DRAFT_502010 [Viridothelium virens]|uniref:Cytochrome b-c1 complex subunit 8 n=1 Tax=Viridothelium virens TaxID=1048519 RepID=A0A6A6HNF6_VIRVR|nr:hypothetical protein EV356DRAFT_502010 [Viridothelium virens]
MRNTLPRFSGGGEDRPGKYLGGWGNLGSQPQKGVVSYGLSQNRQRPFAGAGHAAIFNTWRRFCGQVLFIAPPLLIAYAVMDWAVDRRVT